MPNGFEMRCPKCGSEDDISVAATIWVRLYSNGGDVDGDQEWTDDSPCQCRDCGHEATVKDFQQEEKDKDQEVWFEALQDVRGDYWYVDRRTPDGGETVHGGPEEPLEEHEAREIAERLNKGYLPSPEN